MIYQCVISIIFYTTFLFASEDNNFSLEIFNVSSCSSDGDDVRPLLLARRDAFVRVKGDDEGIPNCSEIQEERLIWQKALDDDIDDVRKNFQNIIWHLCQKELEENQDLFCKQEFEKYKIYGLMSALRMRGQGTLFLSLSVIDQLVETLKNHTAFVQVKVLNVWKEYAEQIRVASKNIDEVLSRARGEVRTVPPRKINKR